MVGRRPFMVGLAAAAALPFGPVQPSQKDFQYESIRWVDETQDPSITLETRQLVAKIIDNTGLRVHPNPDNPAFQGDIAFSHYLGYHAIRAFWRKDERWNIVDPFASWLNLQGLEVEGLQLDPVDSRALYGIGRGWPMRLTREGRGAVLTTPDMPVSGIKYTFRIEPAGEDSLDFEMSFVLQKKNKAKAAFYAEWACYSPPLTRWRCMRPWAALKSRTGSRSARSRASALRASTGVHHQITGRCSCNKRRAALLPCLGTHS